MKKYELVAGTEISFPGRTLFRIKALVAFGDVSAGELGGYVEKEENLDHDGNAWVYGDAMVCGDAEICGDAEVCSDADYTTVKGFGSQYRNTTFFRLKAAKGIGVKCGCFYGSLEEFREKVKKTHGDSRIAKEYLMLADLMEYRFREETKEETKEEPKDEAD